jgi:hypothetical protein
MALQAAGVEIEKLGDNHHPLLEELDLGDRFSFAFVREPLPWYGSIWNFHRPYPIPDWRPLNEWIDLDFPDFLEAMIAHYPGYLSNFYELYTGPPEDQIDFIGHYENLQDDLLLALKRAGQEFDEEELLALPPLNATTAMPECPLETRERLIAAERKAYERHYPASALLER